MYKEIYAVFQGRFLVFKFQRIIDLVEISINCYPSDTFNSYQKKQLENTTLYLSFVCLLIGFSGSQVVTYLALTKSL